MGWGLQGRTEDSQLYWLWGAFSARALGSPGVRSGWGLDVLVGDAVMSQLSVLWNREVAQDG